MSDREDLMKQAEELGLDFPKNIPSEKLSRMVDEALENKEESTEETNTEEYELTAEELEAEASEEAA